MSLSIAKLGDAGSAFAYYSEADDYYMSDHSPAEWHGAGAAALGLAGDIDPAAFHDVLNGKAGDKQVGDPKKRTPGWDMTFSAGKGASVAAFVNKDERVTAAFDASVRDAMDYAERVAATTRQRDGEGHYKWIETHSLTTALVRHNTSRDGDPQLHVHAVTANMTRDPATGEWRSLDSRVLYAARREIENVQANSFAMRLREAGYTVDWHIRANGSIAADIADVSAAERDLFSSRRKEIEAALIAKGIDPATASREARQAATLDTRSPKVHEPGSVLHARWEGQARAAGFDVGKRPSGVGPFAPEARAEAVKQAMESIAERETRFTPRQLLAEAVTYAQGRAGQSDLESAIAAARERGELIDRDVNVRGHGGEIESQTGFTTAAGIAIESDMLARADHLSSRAAHLTVETGAINRVIEEREMKNGHPFTSEQRAAVEAVLSGRDGSLAIIQGYAGTAKTTSVHASIADAAKAAGIRVRAIAPTHSAAETLAQSIGTEYETVAAINVRQLDRDKREEIWIVDEAGMVSAGDMRKLLRKADLSGAQVILSGDVKQIGSVGAGSAFQQLQDAQGGHTHSLTDIKRQTSAQLKQAVYDSLRGDFGASLSKIDTQEIASRDDAVAAIADRYMQDTGAGKSTLVVTLSNADRREVNAAIQQRRVAAGEVKELHDVTTLTQASKTAAEAGDAARYQPGEILEAGRDFRHGPEKGELLTVVRTDGKRVTATRADGSEWTFNPKQTTALRPLEAAQEKFGVGDQIVARGNIAATDADDPAGRQVKVRNGVMLTIDGIDDAGRMQVHDRKDRHLLIDTAGGVKAQLAYAQTANSAQGRTVDSAIAYMRSTQKNLADRQHAYVSLSRAKAHATIITDDREKLADTLAKSARGKQAALDKDGPRGRGHERGKRRGAGLTKAERDTLKAAGVQHKADVRGASKAFAAGSGKAVSAAAKRYAHEQMTGVVKAAKVFGKSAARDLKKAGKSWAFDMGRAVRRRSVTGFAVGAVTATGKATFRVGTAAVKASTKAAWTLSGAQMKGAWKAAKAIGYHGLAALEHAHAASGTDRGLKTAQRLHDIRSVSAERSTFLRSSGKRRSIRA